MIGLRESIACTLLACLLSLAQNALASAPTLAECLEAADFIANAATARDNGLSRADFMGRLQTDLYTIQSFPPPLRWFAHDRDDEVFLTQAAAEVFDRPADPHAHRESFLRACFERLGQGGGQPV